MTERIDTTQRRGSVETWARRRGSVETWAQRRRARLRPLGTAAFAGQKEQRRLRGRDDDGGAETTTAGRHLDPGLDTATATTFGKEDAAAEG